MNAKYEDIIKRIKAGKLTFKATKLSEANDLLKSLKELDSLLTKLADDNYVVAEISLQHKANGVQCIINERHWQAALRETLTVLAYEERQSTLNKLTNLGLVDTEERQALC